MADPLPPSGVPRLLAIMSRLRDPQGGCPWDLEQNFATIAPYTIEEAYEVADAIARENPTDLRDELGDLLFQVVFHARMAEEADEFDFHDVVEAVSEKMVRRHPHVFDTESIDSADAQETAWESQKAAERDAKDGEARAGVLDDVPLSLPALLRAAKLTKRAARVGFDWPDVETVGEKLTEELGELARARAEGPERVAEEMGDVLFVLANMARKLKVDPEDALRSANGKFERRFRHIEARLAEAGRRPEDASLAEMDALWDEAKAREKPDVDAA
ncbi:MAG: nucleoside triphosphate pyrophosphohydrolase [Caulobacterales bacterium]|nr:nucleoside triphosphate pyrophosphohydrolase [Caulobacterales bacterium]